LQFSSALPFNATVVNNAGLVVNATSFPKNISGSGTTTVGPGAVLAAHNVTQGGLTFPLQGSAFGTGYGIITANDLTISGPLTLSLQNGFTPALGNTFDLMSWGTLSGRFSSFNLPSLSTGLAWDTLQLYTIGQLSVVSSNAIPGDFNRDGRVDAADVLAMEKSLANPSAFQAANPSLTAAQLLAIEDVNGDGQFTNEDLEALIAGLQSGGGSASAVPEPPSPALLLWVLPVAVLAARRRRNCQSRSR
jgi:hypothetical protein